LWGAQALEVVTFTDYYEILEISPNANSETIDRIFRHFAQRYHPDNPDTGDRLRFDEIVQAHNTLRDPVKRAQYDIQHKDHWGSHWKLAEEASDRKGIERDVDIQDRLLSILYIKRRRNVDDPGIGNIELEHLSGCPREHLEFHLWYLKEKGWIGRLENGMFAITVDGVDRAHSGPHPKTTLKLLKDRNHPG
jgi:curved DNA-binding protein CbpA